MTLRQLSMCCLLATLFALPVIAQEKPTLTPAEAKASLEAAGFKVGTTGFNLPEEADFAKQIKELLTTRKNLMAAEKDLRIAEGQLEQLKATITNLKAECVRMNAALAGGGLDVTTHNKLVGALNATSGQIDLMLDQQPKANDIIKAARGKTNEAREAYVEQVLKLRSAADRITQTWEKAAADPKQQAALEKVNDVLKKKLALKPTATFAAAERQLQSIEEKVLSETIKVTDDDGTPWVSVVINGKHTKQMVVDSGSTSISLPYAMAKEMDLEPNSTDQEIIVSLADGSEVPGWRKTIPSVRVGKFTVENVECVVLHEKAIKAPPLLGMSYLGQFKFELDLNRAELKMVKVDIDTAKGK